MISRKVSIVGGAGHVGLPLAIAFAGRGQQVTIVDINSEALSKINNGMMPFLESGAEETLRHVIGKTLKTTTENSALSAADVVIIVIGTPVDEHLNPTFQQMRNFIEVLTPYLRPDQTLILRSTVYPGTSQLIYDFLKERVSGIGVAFCPERIAEGKAMEELHTLPQIVSGFSNGAVKMASELFRMLTDEIIIVDPFEAELAKLFTNSWRYIQFATANQFYMIAEENGADFFRIYHAMTYKYPRTQNFPQPGFAAGPCLFKDTMQLSAFTNNNFFLGHSAMLINEGLPNFVIRMMKRQYPDLRSKRVGILGMAFKAESDDPRESLSYKLKKALEIEAGEVWCTDEHITDPHFHPFDKVLAECDILIIGAPHIKYRKTDFSGREVVDVWGVVQR